MTIRELAYSTQLHLEASTGISFKRARIYELLAAAFGFKSYAALGVDSVFTKQRPNDKDVASQSAFVRRRCVELGYQFESAELVSMTLTTFLAERHIGVVRISVLVCQLRGESSGQNVDPMDDDNGLSDTDQDGLLDVRWVDADASITLDGLEAAASRGNALAHYALALIHDSGYEDENEKEVGSSYWHSQEKQGIALTGVQKEWADAHAAHLARVEKHARHLREAGRLGNQHALLDLAERFGDPSFFEQPHHGVGADPSAVAEIAVRLGRVTDAKHWLTVAAERGDANAMLQLIEEHDQGDPARCWTWIYLSRLVGTDLTKDAHYAINEDGSEYDDDVGGPVYVAGRGGINLDPLTAEQDASARVAAQDLYEQIQHAWRSDS